MTSSPKASNPRPAEQGYVLAAVIIMLAVMMVVLATAIPKVRKDIQRDQELETMHRGQQYIRAVQLYYRKFQHYPPNVDALEDTNMMRFLRKRYPDPLTGKDDWTPVLLGQNKAPLSMGYFGQPLTMGAAVLTGTAATGGKGILGASPIGSDSFGSGGSGFQSAFGPPDQGNSGNGDSSGNSSGSQGSGLPNAGPVLGGAGIIGFSPALDKDSILVYKTKVHYTEWEFVYDPLADRARGGMPLAPPPPTGPPTNSGAPGFGNPNLPPPGPGR
jgi:type II secretory pathway pseudopilin PulG